VGVVGVQQFDCTALNHAAKMGFLSLVQLLVERAPNLLELGGMVSGEMVNNIVRVLK
jgi:hypothetical protein